MDENMRELDAVVLRRDIPASGLQAGDLGTVVHSEGRSALVEFVTASGRAEAILTLDASDVRPVGDDDLIAVRSIQPARRR